jgi:hypothetical protein
MHTCSAHPARALTRQCAAQAACAHPTCLQLFHHFANDPTIFPAPGGVSEVHGTQAISPPRAARQDEKSALSECLRRSLEATQAAVKASGEDVAAGTDVERVVTHARASARAAGPVRCCRKDCTHHPRRWACRFARQLATSATLISITSVRDGSLHKLLQGLIPDKHA